MSQVNTPEDNKVAIIKRIEEALSKLQVSPVGWFHANRAKICDLQDVVNTIKNKQHSADTPVAFLRITGKSLTTWLLMAEELVADLEVWRASIMQPIENNAGIPDAFAQGLKSTSSTEDKATFYFTKPNVKIAGVSASMDGPAKLHFDSQATLEVLSDAHLVKTKHSHYHKDVSHLEMVDVYRVLKLFNVTDPCLQHAIKKLLVAGGRGAGKNIDKDISEAKDSLVRWEEMRDEDESKSWQRAEVPWQPPVEPNNTPPLSPPFTATTKEAREESVRKEYETRAIARVRRVHGWNSEFERKAVQVLRTMTLQEMEVAYPSITMLDKEIARVDMFNINELRSERDRRGAISYSLVTYAGRTLQEWSYIIESDSRLCGTDTDGRMIELIKWSHEAVTDVYEFNVSDYMDKPCASGAWLIFGKWLEQQDFFNKLTPDHMHEFINIYVALLILELSSES